MIPQSEQELADLVRAADGPVRIVGGGTRSAEQLAGRQELSTTSLSGITLYEPGALTLVAQAGTPVGEIEAVLRAENQMLAFEPYDLSDVTRVKGASTIGGVVATNASGARRVQAGAARDFLLGVRFVDGQGQVLKNGGRVMKNVTGYDLVKLMAGSWGTLGVLSEVSLKVLPMPEHVMTVGIVGLSDENAVAAMSAALGSPFDVTGAVHAPACIEEEPFTMVRIEGFENSVRYRAEKLKDLLGRFGEVITSENAEGWKVMRDMVTFSQSARGPGGAFWQLSLKPSDAAPIMAGISDQFDVQFCYDWGGGRVWVWAGEDVDQEALHGALQDNAARVGGHATLIHSETALAVPKFQPLSPALSRLTQGLRQKFDPRGILNPGLME
ncbi:FAD-binding protein [Aliiroseovarius halocynthiae]|uniref:FAD-binding protein n=1 Tax=Aliiroseovarius halocynthiae TaxID=985055 RepID=A0A545SX28_9RHOB|nr:FAD-binding protein [Aliiroseovarius halocynthiae]TQV69522.1 FAD-binding protein [Aliiroseovarius halocynthiae]